MISGGTSLPPGTGHPVIVPPAIRQLEPVGITTFTAGPGAEVAVNPLPVAARHITSLPAIQSCHEQALAGVQSLQKNLSGYTPGVPVFCPSLPPLEVLYPRLRELPDSQPGPLKLEVTRAYYELSEILCQEGRLNVGERENLMSGFIDGLLTSQDHDLGQYLKDSLTRLREQCSQASYGYGCLDSMFILVDLGIGDWQKLINPCTYERYQEVLVFFIKFISYQEKHKIRPGIIGSTYGILFLDMLLAKAAVDDPWLVLKLSPQQFCRWMQLWKLVFDKVRSHFPMVLSNSSLCPVAKANELLWSLGKHELLCSTAPDASLNRRAACALEEYLTGWLAEITGQLLFINKSGRADPAIATKPAFHRDKVLFGEEFEFSHKNGVLVKDLASRLQEWRQELSQTLQQQGVEDYHITLGIDNLVLQVGDWSYKLFRDICLLEVNATPYQPDQLFPVTIRGDIRQYSAYDMFDQFIHPVARALGCLGISGHKHLDIRYALDGNAELMLRVIMDLENAAWLPRILGREKSTAVFPNIYQEKPKSAQMLKNIIKAVNDRWQNDASPLWGDYEHLVSLVSFLRQFSILSKGPCALSHIRAGEHTADLHKEPKSTLEFRLFHCPRDGHESELVNKLLMARIQYHLDRQRGREPIVYTPEHPDTYQSGRDIDAVNAFARYVSECGESPAKFAPLIRIPIPEQCRHLFESEQPVQTR